MIGLSRSAFGGRSGVKASLQGASYSGTQVGTLITLGAGVSHRAVARIVRDTWDTPGTTITIRAYRRVGPTRTLIGAGTVASGPTSAKGVTIVSPALPMITTPALANGDFEIEVETVGSVRYSAEFVT